jgi:hypothetical protein
MTCSIICEESCVDPDKHFVCCCIIQVVDLLKEEVLKKGCSWSCECKVFLNSLKSLCGVVDVLQGHLSRTFIKDLSCDGRGIRFDDVNLSKTSSLDIFS